MCLPTCSVAIQLRRCQAQSFAIDILLITCVSRRVYGLIEVNYMHMKHGCLRDKNCSADVLVQGTLSKGQPVIRCGNGLAILSVTLLVSCIGISESLLAKDCVVREDV